MQWHGCIELCSALDLFPRLFSSKAVMVLSDSLFCHACNRSWLDIKHHMILM